MKADELIPGELLEWKPGPWKVVKVYPWHPVGPHEYAQTVDIAGPDGQVITVDDKFIATWFTRASGGIAD